jgi:hypothetical protein
VSSGKNAASRDAQVVQAASIRASGEARLTTSCGKAGEVML